MVAASALASELAYLPALVQVEARELAPQYCWKMARKFTLEFIAAATIIVAAFEHPK